MTFPDIETDIEIRKTQMTRITLPLKRAVTAALCACILLLPMYLIGTLIWLANAFLLHRSGEQAGFAIGSTGVWVAALLLLAAIAGFVYGIFEAFRPNSESKS
jgi:hypothetical protein